MLEHLFGSKTRFKLLKVFFRDPEKPYFVRELTREIEAHIHAVRRELGLLQKVGIVEAVDAVVDKDSAKPGLTLRKYYRLNQTSTIYPELQALLLKAQVLGEQKFTQEILNKAGKIKLFIITGRFTQELNVQTDALLIGDIKSRTLEKIITKYEKEFGFEIRYTVMTTKEFYDRRFIMDKFLYLLFEAKHIKVVNELEL